MAGVVDSHVGGPGVRVKLEGFDDEWLHMGGVRKEGETNNPEAIE